MPRIFISYRRADSVTVTGRIYDHLVNAFGDDLVFKDVDDIPPGADFRAALEHEVSACNVLLAIIGPGWVASGTPEGARRLDNPDDFVRIEIEAGLTRPDVLVIPVLVYGAPMPGSADLPPGMQELAYRNAAIIRDDPDFRRDMERLIAKIREFAAVREAPAPPPKPETRPPSPASVQTAPIQPDLFKTAPIQRPGAGQVRPARAASGKPPTRNRRWPLLGGIGLLVAIAAGVAALLANPSQPTDQTPPVPTSDTFLSGIPAGDRSLACGGEFHGYLSDSIPQETWTLTAAGQGEWVLLTLDAEPGGGLDPLLTLRDPAGEVVKQDDDSGLENNARADFQLWSPGDWTVEAARYGGSGSGNYRVTVICDFQAIACNNETYGQLSTGHPEERWLFLGTEGKPISVSLRHANRNADNTYLNTSLTLLDPGDNVLEQNDDVSPSNTDSRISFTLPEEGIYSLIVGRSDSDASQEYAWGEYVLHLECDSLQQQAAPQSQTAP